LTGPGSTRSPVGRETVQDRIYRQLRIALIQARFDAGEIFLAGDVAQRMSVSSMPVREALARLVSERALEAMPNRRVRVPLLTWSGRGISLRHAP
jgi:DNA-binding GntR family transcriptional regulator